MKRSSYLLVLMLVWVVAAFSASAATLSARVVLPDGSGAPFAMVTIGDKVFTASETGKVEITYDGEKTALVKWLELEEEIAIGATMKFSNRLYYGAPYDANDFVTWGPDIWEITESAMYCPGGLGNEAQIFLDDFYDNFVMRAKFSAEAESQWFYLRFMIRGVEPGFNGYGVTVAMHPADQSSFARFNGSWDNYDVITEDIFIGPAMDPGVEDEIVVFAKDEHIVVYLRNAGQKDYMKVVDHIDDDPGAFFDGGVGILNSFTVVEITEFSVFRY